MQPFLALWPLLIPAFLLFIWPIMIYNRLVRLRNYCDEAWADVTTELKRRYDLIPTLVSAVKGAMAHEVKLLDKVLESRNRAVGNNGSPAQQAVDEKDLMTSLRQLMVTVENYPEVKSNQNVNQLQTELANTEDRIQRARRFYNNNVRDLNIQIDSFPSNLMAGICGATKRELFEIDDPAIHVMPKIDLQG